MLRTKIRNDVAATSVLLLTLTGCGLASALPAAKAPSMTAAQTPARRYIPVEEARHLAYEAQLRQYGDADAVIDFNPDQEKKGLEPDFYGFSTEFSGPFGDVGLGYYSVNRWTGDVWNIVGSVCHPVSSVLIQNLQEGIRDRAGWQNPGYAALRAKRPMVCDPD